MVNTLLTISLIVNLILAFVLIYFVTHYKKEIGEMYVRGQASAYQEVLSSLNTIVEGEIKNESSDV